MDQRVHPAAVPEDVPDRGGDLFGIGEVHLVPVGLSTGFANRFERVEGRPAAFDPGELALDELRGWALALCLDPLGQLTLQAVAV